MQRTMKAGPARRRIERPPRSNAASGMMQTRRKRLCEDVRHVVVRSNFAHLDVAMRHVLAHFQIASVDVAR
eukprot:4690141-Pleurochrysis_carterae.AAC.1